VHGTTEDKSDSTKDSFYEEPECILDQFQKYNMKMLGDYNAKVGRQDIFKPKIGNETLHEISYDNGIRVGNFATSENLIVKNTVFPNRNIHIYTWTSPDKKTHNQIDHVLMDKRRHSSVVDVRSFNGAYCDTDHNLVVAEVGNRFSVSKRAAQKFDMEGFNLKKLNGVEVLSS
jgi:hypothetical protein